MFKKMFNKQTLIAFVLGGLMFSSIPVFAETIQYVFTQSNCKLIIDGKEYSNPDIPVTLYLKDQSNYAPLAVIRDICLKLNIPFEYDNTTKEINITTTRKEEIVLSETVTSIETTTTTETITTEPTNNLITYEEDGLTIVELDNVKYIRLNSLDEKLRSINYKIWNKTITTTYLRYGNDDENLSEPINLYGRGLVGLTGYKKFNDSFVYMKYNDYLNKIKPLIKTGE
jgi:hypothetical protein